MVDLWGGLPFQLAARPTGVELESITNLSWDIAIGGLPFMLDLAAQEPVRRVTNDYLRQQFDNSGSAGEQTLTGWWLRSQSRFDDGAGITYFEPLAGDGSEKRFTSSVGLDVFTVPGEVRLCRRMDSVDGSALGAYAALAKGTDRVQVLGAAKVGSISSAGSFAAGAAVGATPSVAVGPDDGVWIGSTSGIAKDSVSKWTTSSGAVKVWWVKSRLFAAQGQDLFELNPTGGNLDAETPLAIPTATTAGWSWTRVVETPGAVWAVGVDSFKQGRVFSITKNDQSQTVVTEALTLPVGEDVLSAYGYLGYILLGTSRGLRVCPTQGSDAVLGPAVGDAAIYAVTAWGDSVYGAGWGTHDSLSGVYRVDLSNSLGDGRFPWARETFTSSSAQPLGIEMLPGTNRLVVLTTDGLFLQSATTLLPSGWLQTGWIRWGTQEPKWFEAVVANSDTTAGTVDIYSVDSSGPHLIGQAAADANGSEAKIVLPDRPASQLGLKFVLKPSLGNGSPVLRGYQLRGLPVPRRQRLLSIPVRVLDRDVDRYGNRWGREHWAMGRQFGLEALEERGTPVWFQDFRTGEARRVIIQKVAHIQQLPPDGRFDNAEGTTVVQMLALDAAQFSPDDFESVG